MSSYQNAAPPELFEDDDDEDSDVYVQQPTVSQQNLSTELQKQIIGIKVIPKLGSAAGLNKSDFDIQLDTNSQQWFDQIHQHWRQCKLILSNSHTQVAQWKLVVFKVI